MRSYLINGKKYLLKDLTLKESKEVNKLLKINQTTGDFAANFNNDDDIEKYLQIVLVDETGAKAEIDFSEHVTEKMLLEILKDFFSVRINQAKGLQDFLVSSIKRRKK